MKARFTIDVVVGPIVLMAAASVLLQLMLTLQ